MKERFTKGIDLAEDFVTSIEDSHLDDLREHMNQSECASKLCGCRTCKHVEKFARLRFEDEIIRIYGDDDFFEDINKEIKEDLEDTYHQYP